MQPINAQQGQHLGAGVHVDVKLPIKAAALKGTLGPALQRVLSERSYKESAQHISRLMRATRWTPAEKAASVRHLACLPAHA